MRSENSLATIMGENAPVELALHLDYPSAGSRMLRDMLRAADVSIGRDFVITMMLRMAMEAIWLRPNTSKPARGHNIYR